DHLSRSDIATSGWGSPSTSGTFLGYTTVPAPGAIALLGLAGLAGRRRRS
ncbi:MAG: PEP-CTERM sorting domain-containing protein, partial [Planctomycetota bacterium]